MPLGCVWSRARHGCLWDIAFTGVVQIHMREVQNIGPVKD